VPLQQLLVDIDVVRVTVTLLSGVNFVTTPADSTRKNAIILGTQAVGQQEGANPSGPLWVGNVTVNPATGAITLTLMNGALAIQADASWDITFAKSRETFGA
jgi:hypothetical protein